MVDGQVAIVYSATTTRGSTLVSDPEPGNRLRCDQSICEAVLEVLPDIVLIHDAELILFANAACRRFLDAPSPEALEGRPLDVIVHPDAYAAGRERRNLVLEGGQTFRALPLKVVTLAGEPKHLSADAYPISLDGTRAAMVVGLPESLRLSGLCPVSATRALR